MAAPKKRRKKLRKRKWRQRVGAVPGSVEVDPSAPQASVNMLRYSVDKLEETPVEDLAELKKLAEDSQRILWLDVVGVSDTPTVTTIGEIFGIHPLAVEDIVHVDQRPKFELYPGCGFFVLRMARREEDGLDVEQVSMTVLPNVVITFQEREGDVFGKVRERIREARGRIRSQGAGYLAYAIVDAIVDAYFPVIENISDELEVLEDKLYSDNPPEDASQDIHSFRRELTRLRRSIWPLREALSTLVREESDLFDEDTRIYLRDCTDHTTQLVEIVDTERDVCNSLMDLYLTAMSNRMNEVMKVLTIIATVFMPLGFVAGLYGMNFDTGSPYNMPELSWRFGYPGVLGFMALTFLGMLYLFRRLGWIGPKNR